MEMRQQSMGTLTSELGLGGVLGPLPEEGHSPPELTRRHLGF